MRAKPAVVRILSGYVGRWEWRGRQWNTSLIASGSGFIFNPNGYILTNAHVVQMTRDGDEAGKEALLQQLARAALEALNEPVNQSTISQAMRVLIREAGLVELRRVNYVFLQSGSRYPFEIKSYGAPLGEGKDLAIGKDVAVIKIEIKNAPVIRPGNSDQMQVGDSVWVIGYPGAGDSAALDDRSQLEPTTNDGKISAKKTSADGVPILQTNASTTHGNSGGPVINDKGEAIGLLTFGGNPIGGQEVQGFNFIVPVNTALEFVRQAGTEYRESPIDKLWSEGLNHYWKQAYSRAEESFAGVTALFPDRSEAVRLITDSQEHIARGEDKSGGFEFSITGWKALLIIAAVFLLIPAAAVAGLVFLLKKRKVRTPASGKPAVVTSAQLPPRSGVPVVVSPPHPITPAVAPPPPVAAPVAQSVRAEAIANTTSSGKPHGTEKLMPFVPTEKLQAVVVPRLVFTVGPLKGQEFTINQGLFLGRDQARAQVVIPESQVSGRHLWVGFVDGRVMARDDGSTNDTFLNHQMNQRVTEAELKDGDVLTLGGKGAVEFAVRM
ncbi:MAG TPA: trypsin-like peptidase domain-containing protein [Blastocatellia bacterium]|nr:trypsin-like peptidase domain-containing protein [Blastocatellia bacterium]